MVSHIITNLCLTDVDHFFSFPETYPKVTSPKSSLLLSPGPTNNSSHFGVELSEENAFSFKENDILSLSHSNSKDFNELDFSFVENDLCNQNPPKEISRSLSDDALVQIIGFLNHAASMELQNCELYKPFEFRSLMPLEMNQEENELKIQFKDGGYNPEKVEKRLSKMRLLRNNQENFTQHFCKYKDFTDKCNENWQLLERIPSGEVNLKIESEKVSQRSKKCKKVKNGQKKNVQIKKEESCYLKNGWHANNNNSFE